MSDDDGFTFTQPTRSDLPPAEELICQHPGCEVELTYGGRGRKPRFCDDHKQTAQTAPTAKRTTRGMLRIEEALTANIAAIGHLTQFVEPFDGAVIIHNAPPMSRALCSVAEADPRFRKKLEKMLEGTAWAQVFTALAGMMVPILVHHGIIPMDAQARAFMESMFVRAAQPSAEGTADNGHDGSV